MAEEITTWSLLAIVVLGVLLCIALFINVVSVFTIRTKKQFHTAVNMYQLVIKLKYSINLRCPDEWGKLFAKWYIFSSIENCI